MADKWGRRLFTAGAVLLLLIGCVHSISLFVKPAAANETERQMLDLMSNCKFNLMGSMRSMDNLMRGFSISFMLGALVMGALDLMLRHERAGLLKQVALINTIWLAAMTAVSLYYFFCFAHFVSGSRAAVLCPGLDETSGRDTAGVKVVAHLKRKAWR